jgi:hypothetical protein
MIRTQISLTQDDYDAAKREAARQGISLAELVRRCLHAVLPAAAAKPWMDFAGIVQSGDPDSSRKIDDVVYGDKE